jgi:replicative DNA helicase
MVVIAARPSVGKTSFATSIAVAAAKDGRKVLFFSLEVTRERLVLNMLCMEGRVDSGLLLPGQVIPNSAFEGLSRGIDVLSPLPLLIDDSSADPATLRAKCLRQKSRDGLDLVVVDYLGLVDTSAVRTRSSNRENEVAWLSQRLKELAKELKVPLIALSQLNRLSMTRTDHRPLLSDLRDSGCIEQDADVVLLLHREERCVTDPRKRQEVAGQAELIVAKNRNGPIGTLPLAFDGRYFMFSEISSGRSARS